MHEIERCRLAEMWIGRVRRLALRTDGEAHGPLGSECERAVGRLAVHERTADEARALQPLVGRVCAFVRRLFANHEQQRDRQSIAPKALRRTEHRRRDALRVARASAVQTMVVTRGGQKGRHRVQMCGQGDVRTIAGRGEDVRAVAAHGNGRDAPAALGECASECAHQRGLGAARRIDRHQPLGDGGDVRGTGGKGICRHAEGCACAQSRSTARSHTNLSHLAPCSRARRGCPPTAARIVVDCGQPAVRARASGSGSVLHSRPRPRTLGDIARSPQ